MSHHFPRFTNPPSKNARHSEGRKLKRFCGSIIGHFDADILQAAVAYTHTHTHPCTSVILNIINVSCMVSPHTFAAHSILVLTCMFCTLYVDRMCFRAHIFDFKSTGTSTTHLNFWATAIPTCVVAMPCGDIPDLPFYERKYIMQRAPSTTSTLTQL